MGLIDSKDAKRVIEVQAGIARMREVLKNLDEGRGRVGKASMRMEISRKDRPYDQGQEYKIEDTAIKVVVFGYIRRQYQLALDECNRELRRLGAL